MDTQTFYTNDDGSAVIIWQFDITGTSLQPGDANNNTVYNLAPATDGSTWTLESAVTATATQAETDKTAWISALTSLGL